MGTHDYEVYSTFRDARTPFNELRVSEFTPLIELDSSNGLSDLRDIQTTTNSGSISNTKGQHKLSTGTTASSTAQLDTAEKGRYQPGIVGLPGIGVRRPSAPTGNQVWKAGYFDDDDGVFIGEDSSGVFLQLRVGGTDKDPVYQQDWNIDTMDGNADGENRSARNLDLSHPVVVRFPLVWYFGGPIRVEILEANTPSTSTSSVFVHEFFSTAGEPIIEQPKLPVRAEVDNGGDTNNLDLFVGGRQFAVLGRYLPNRRETDELREGLAVSTTLVPTVSFRKKSDRTSKAKSIKIAGYGVASDTDAVIEIHLDPGLTGASFGSVSDVPDSETAVESDISATGMTAGQVIERILVTGTVGSRANVSGIKKLGLDIPDDATITVGVRTLNGDGTVNVVFGIEEEW